MSVVTVQILYVHFWTYGSRTRAAVPIVQCVENGSHMVINNNNELCSLLGGEGLITESKYLSFCSPELVINRSEERRVGKECQP